MPMEDLAFDQTELARVYAHRAHGYRRRLEAILSQDVFAPQYGLALEEKRSLTHRRMQALVASKVISTRDLQDNPYKWFAFFETVYARDANVALKFVVHMMLFGGTVCGNGTSAQFTQVAGALDTLSEMGAFAMTEIAHGSNVQGIRTVAKWDRVRRELVLDTPSDHDQKIWIGGASDYGTLSVVFAQLQADGKPEGVHSFLVRLRDARGRVCAGITIRDMGAKMGLDGVDNARLWFRGVRLPETALLSRHGHFDRAGTYQSPHRSLGQRFGMTMSPLSGGRISVSLNAMSALRMALVVTVRYCAQRRQFARRAGEPEHRLIDYPNIQRSILHAAAVYTVVSLNLAHAQDLYARYIQSRNPKYLGELHRHTSAVKPLATWGKTACLQALRECCGGQGLLMRNQIAGMMLDSNVDVTYEGANAMVLLQVVKSALRKPAPAGGAAPAHVPAERVLRLDGLEALFALRAREMVAALRTKLEQDTHGNTARAAIFSALSHRVGRAIEVGRAIAHHRIIACVRARIGAAPAGVRGVLGALARLWALHTLATHGLWYLGTGAIDARTARTVFRHTRALVQGMAAAHVPERLVGALNVPGTFISAPIAHPLAQAFHANGCVGSEVRAARHRHTLAVPPFGRARL